MAIILLISVIYVYNNKGSGKSNIIKFGSQTNFISKRFLANLAF